MKIVLTILMSCAVLAGAHAGLLNDGNVTGSTKEENLFVVKADKSLVGALVEIYSPNGELLTAQHLAKRKLVIDFSAADKGAYTIRVVKGDEAHELHFEKMESNASKRL